MIKYIYYASVQTNEDRLRDVWTIYRAKIKEFNPNASVWCGEPICGIQGESRADERVLQLNHGLTIREVLLKYQQQLKKIDY